VARAPARLPAPPPAASAAPPTQLGQVIVEVGDLEAHAGRHRHVPVVLHHLPAGQGRAVRQAGRGRQDQRLAHVQRPLGHLLFLPVRVRVLLAQVLP
jgi:hypothetical protein